MAPLGCDSFLRLHLFLVIMTVLRSSSWDIIRCPCVGIRYFSWFDWVYGFLGGISQKYNGHFHHILSGVHTIHPRHHRWGEFWPFGEVTFVRFLHCSYSFPPFSMLYSLDCSYHVQPHLRSFGVEVQLLLLEGGVPTYWYIGWNPSAQENCIFYIVI